MVRFATVSRCGLAAGILLLHPASSGAYCVEDADGALWFDCEQVRQGAVRTSTKCRREPGAEKIPVEPKRRLEPGDGDCPGGRSRDVLLGKDGLPRNDGAEDRAGDVADDGGAAAGAFDHD
jgi:hypothetical protein